LLFALVKGVGIMVGMIWGGVRVEIEGFFDKKWDFTRHCQKKGLKKGVLSVLECAFFVCFFLSQN